MADLTRKEVIAWLRDAVATLGKAADILEEMQPEAAAETWQDRRAKHKATLPECTHEWLKGILSRRWHQIGILERRSSSTWAEIEAMLKSDPRFVRMKNGRWFYAEGQVTE